MKISNRYMMVLALCLTTAGGMANFPDSSQDEAKRMIDANCAKDSDFRDLEFSLRSTLPKYIAYLRGGEKSNGLQKNDEEVAKAFYDRYAGKAAGKGSLKKPFVPQSKAVQKSASFGWRKLGSYALIHKNGKQLFRLYSKEMDQRAPIIVDRFKKLNSTTASWWSSLKATHRDMGNGNFEWIVTSPSAALKGHHKGVLVTADSKFAVQCGKSQKDLAYELVDLIKLRFDPEKGSATHRADEGPSEVEIRQKAMDLECEADAILSSDKSQAESLYRNALAADPSYGGSCLSLADMLFKAGRKEEAVQLLQEALTSTNFNEVFKAQFQEKLAVIKG